MTSTSGPSASPESLAGLALDLDDDAIDLAHRIVEILRQVPGPRSLDEQGQMEIAAWTAIALRRGRRRDDGRRICLDDLRGLGLDDWVVEVAWLVGGDRRRGEEGARRLVLGTSMTARLVWVTWWISRVEQARERRLRSTWKTLASKADRQCEDVLADLPEAARAWMQRRLDRTRWPTPIA